MCYSVRILGEFLFLYQVPQPINRIPILQRTHRSPINLPVNLKGLNVLYPSVSPDEEFILESKFIHDPKDLPIRCLGKSYLPIFLYNLVDDLNAEALGLQVKIEVDEEFIL